MTMQLVFARMHLEPGDYGSCVHYVAVSYRWRRPDPKGGRYNIISDSLSREKNTAPDEVLDRAIHFAAHCKVPFVWIDQECEEKETAIQSMDLVYQHAVASIRLLDVTITTQEDMDILDSMLRLDELSAQQFVGSLNLLERLVRDEWMSRAWVYQEVAAAGSRMVLLLKCDPALHRAFRDRGDHLTNSLNILGEYDILPGELIRAIRYLENWPIISGHSVSKQVQSRLDKASSFIKSTLSGDSPLFGRLIGHFQEPMPWEEQKRAIRDPQYRPLVSVVEALQGLEGRSNSRIPDRITILGNLCTYGKRLNTQSIQNVGSVGFYEHKCFCACSP
ncbi:hypothetical protein HYALB_00009623 [Hymenoscyphus albidus]|uniref:Heterokaryon incompatibility domain-containing protein n=1 Tax=Hymenoscyphus albidus TaxID=595503 RepID=A0A9N9LNT3_9HELO|nr:hypothetical protein HYALB_00009623 [Hymenoscyphus albidus]